MGGRRPRRRRPAYPWGDTFDPSAATAPRRWGWTVAVTAHPQGAGPSGAEQLAGNVWEWVSDRTPDGWGVVRAAATSTPPGALRAARELPADPARATNTTGFRIAIDPGRSA